MGQIRKYARHKPWTLEEINKLELFCDKGYSPTAIAKNLGRTTSSVKCKRIQLGLSGMKESIDRLNIADVAELCGVCKDSVNRTWRNRGLKTRKSGGMRFVQEKDLFAFMQQNTDLWNASDCDEYFFSGKKWFIDKLAEEKATGKRRKTYKKWTEYEKARVQMLWQRGLGYNEIAQRMDRTKHSVYLYVNRNLIGSVKNEQNTKSNKKLLGTRRL